MVGGLIVYVWIHKFIYFIKCHKNGGLKDPWPLIRTTGYTVGMDYRHMHFVYFCKSFYPQFLQPGMPFATEAVKGSILLAKMCEFPNTLWNTEWETGSQGQLNHRPSVMKPQPLYIL